MGVVMDLNRARQLMVDAGYANGFDVQVHCLADQVLGYGTRKGVTGLVFSSASEPLLRTGPRDQHERLHGSRSLR